MATASKPLKSWGLRCPECGAKDSLRLELNRLSSVVCSACDDAESSPEAARRTVADQLRRWEAFGAWLALAGGVLDEAESAGG
jgi:hypothetical protein